MSYLRDHLEYCGESEAPEIWHIFGAYSTLSAVVSRRVWLPFADRFVFPNIYVVLVGGAGNAKNEAMYRPIYLMSALNVSRSGSVETPEGFWRYMAGDPTTKPPTESPVRKACHGPLGDMIEYHPMAIIATELVNFISPNPEGWVNALNDIFDCQPYTYRTKNKGTDILDNPYITLFGALTTEVSANLQKQNIIGTGLARRTFFVFGERRWDNPVPWPEFLPEQAAARDRCLEHLRLIDAKARGCFTYTPAAREWWDTWYRANHKEVPGASLSIKSWLGTKAARLQQMAMLTSLSEGVSMTIDIPHLEIPLEYMTILEADLPRIFGGVGRNELAAVAQRIHDYLSNLTVPMERRVLRSKFFNECKQGSEFDECITFLKDSDQIWTIDLQIGSFLQECIAIPTVMAKHILATARTRPDAVTPTLLQKAKQLVLDRAALLDATPSVTEVTEALAASSPPVETATGQPPEVEMPEGSLTEGMNFVPLWVPPPVEDREET